MTVKIETYRNFDISLDTDTGEFISVSDYYDTQNKKTSYNAAKKAIDDFIKANQEFKPFFAVEISDDYWDKEGPYLVFGGKKEKVVAQRKDGRFVTEGGKQISDLESKKLTPYKPEFEDAYEAMRPLFNECESLKLRVKQLEKEIKDAGRIAGLQNINQYAKQ